MAQGKDPIERAIKRFKEVKEIMDKAASVRQEYYDLEAFLNQAHKLFPDVFDEWPLPGMLGPPSAATPPDASQKPLGHLQTSDYAEWVMRVHGPLHIREIVKRMREEGWAGNPSDTVAAKTVFNILANKPDRFRNSGKNIWALVEKKP
jgi:hypothetical protein